MIGPPSHIPPERLFAILADPAPRQALTATLEGFALEVRAIPAQEHAAAWFAAQAAPMEVRRVRYARELLARCVWTATGERLTAADLGMLSAVELSALSTEALDVLATIGPTYARVDWPAWQAALEKGARHGLNASAAVALASCVDYGHGATTYRPDRFYGVPMKDVLDGHWFCFRAARAAWVDDDKPKSISDAIRQAQTRRAG